MTQAAQLSLSPADNTRLANLCGPLDEHLRQIERHLAVEISNRGVAFTVRGDPAAVSTAESLLGALYQQTAKESLNAEKVHIFLQEANLKTLPSALQSSNIAAIDEVEIKTRRGFITGRGPRQKHYLSCIQQQDLTFGIGPAGTGKTYLAVACAVQALESEQVRRILLVRPAVEAGEKLGFLPGDLTQKVDPYLRPLYDALYEMLGFERVEKLMDKHVIEVAPLAFMRGRTLNESYIILDEAQNTTVEQMKMFLTRIGFGSKAVVTGDISQTDLPRNQTSGLKQVQTILKNIDGVSFCHFDHQDVVRHPLVKRIVNAYDKWDSQQASANLGSEASFKPV